MKKIRIVFSLLIIFQIAKSQNLTNEEFQKLFNNTDYPSLYKTQDGKTLCCGFALECENLNIQFYTIHFDKLKRKLRIEGHCYSFIDQDRFGNYDSMQNYGFKILLVNTKQISSYEKLILKSKEIYEDTVSHIYKIGFENFPSRTGDFRVEFTFTPNDQLLFVSRMTYAREFKIGELLRKEN